MKRNMLDFANTMRRLGFLEQQQRDSRIRFGSNQVHIIPSREELLDQKQNTGKQGLTDKMSDLDLSKLSSFSRRSTSRDPSRSILKRRKPSYKRPSLLHSRRRTSRRSVPPTLQE